MYELDIQEINAVSGGFVCGGLCAAGFFAAGAAVGAGGTYLAIDAIRN